MSRSILVTIRSTTHSNVHCGWVFFRLPIDLLVTNFIRFNRVYCLYYFTSSQKLFLFPRFSVRNYSLTWMLRRIPLSAIYFLIVTWHYCIHAALVNLGVEQVHKCFILSIISVILSIFTSSFNKPYLHELYLCICNLICYQNHSRLNTLNVVS